MTQPRPVIIVGGGLNGLALAVLLADLQVPCVVLERHANTSIQYKFAGISPRSMEIFRAVGLEGEIRANKTGDQQAGGIGRGANLADPNLQWTDMAWPDASPFSPTQPATCDQHVLEPILRRRAEALGADVRFNTAFLGLEQRASGVHVSARTKGGADYTLEGSYLVAADGANGTLREQLGIGRSGPGVLQHWMNIIFDTDLPPTLQGRPFTSCFVSDINATFTPRPGGRWLLATQYSPDKGEGPEQFDEARCRALIEKGAGRAGVRVELVDVRAWDAAAYVADTFRAGRCFLLGDAAHLMPPTGAFGGNSGIHDAQNLAWKLAYVTRGRASDGLLDTYDAERRPLIAATLGQALARLQRWFKDLSGRLPPPVEMVADYDVVFGQRYASGAIVHESSAADDAPFVHHAELSGAPGTRLPHRPIVWRERECSTLDLAGRRFVLLCGKEGEAWRDTTGKLAERGFDVGYLQFGAGDLERAASVWPAPFGVEASGALLVRPDGFVAWRALSLASDPEAALATALGRLGLTCPPA